MLADSGVPPLRGTLGLWNNYPALKQQGIPFEHMVHIDMFDQDPSKFWYLQGDLYNKYKEAEPHTGYADLLEILKMSEKQWFLYHEGTDLLYEKAGNYNITLLVL